MRDLEFLVGSADLGSLVLYRYKSEPLRRSVLDKIRRIVEADGSRLVLCDQNDFARRLHGGGLFDSETEVPFLDWSQSLDPPVTDENLTSGASQIDGAGGRRTDAGNEIGRSESNCGLSGLIALAKERPSGSRRAVLFVDDAFVGAWWSSKATTELKIDGSMELRRVDIPALARAFAEGLDARRAADLEKAAYLVWGAGCRSVDLVETVDTVSVCFKAGVGWKWEEADRPDHSPRLSKPVMQELIFGRQATRFELVENFLLNGLSGPRILRELVLATMRAKPVQKMGEGVNRATSELKYHQWSVWLCALLKHAPSLGSAKRSNETVWTQPDRRATALLCLLDEFQMLRGSVGGRPDNLSQSVSVGAEWIRVNFVDLSQRIIRGLKESTLGYDNIHFAQLSPEMKILTDAWVRLAEAAVEIPLPPQPDTGTWLDSLDDLAGQSTLKSIFLRSFDDRYQEVRAYRKPILLVGEHGVGKRSVADLLGRLFVCDQATSRKPRACGMCHGCQSVDIRIASLDISSMVGSNAMQDFLRVRARGRGTVSGTPVTVLHNVDRLPAASCLVILKTYESTFGTGLTVFTATNLGEVDAALKSRCLVVHLWPERG